MRRCALYPSLWVCVACSVTETHVSVVRHGPDLEDSSNAALDASAADAERGGEDGAAPDADIPSVSLTESIGGGRDAGALGVSANARNGSMLWVEQLVSQNGAARAVATFADGSVVIAGVYFEQLILDPEAGEGIELTRPGSSSSRVFVAKYSADQDVVWVRDTELEGNSFPNSVAVMSDESVVVVGSFAAPEMTFGRGESNETTLLNAGGTDAFIARYSVDGELLWAQAGASPDNEAFGEVEVLSDGSLVVVGNDVELPESHPTVFGQGQVEETQLESRGGFVARYTADGELLWAQATGAATAWDVEVMPNGEVVVLGYFFGEATLGRGQDAEATFMTYGDRDTVLSRYTAEGRMLWARAFGELGSNDQPTDMVAAPDGSLWMSTGSAIEMGGNSRSYWSSLVHLHPDGTLDWVDARMGSLTHRGEMAALSDGSCVMASRLEGEVTLEVAGQGVLTFSDEGRANILLRRYHPSGQLLWARRGGGVGRDHDAVDGIDAFIDDSVVIVGGLFTGEVVFGEGDADEIRFQVEGNRTPYFAKFLP